MTPHVIVSYDGSPLDRDALALGAVLRDLGADLTLAYVRHARETRADRELIAEVEAENRLRDGAARLGAPDTPIRLVVHPSTAAGLAGLAQESGADIIVFASEHRTPEGRVGLLNSAQSLLEGGPAALAIAPAGYERRVGGTSGGGPVPQSIGVLAGSADAAAIETAHALSRRTGAPVTDRAHGVDLLVVGSRSHAAAGRVMVSASAAVAIEEARAPVLVTARESALSFGALVSA